MSYNFYACQLIHRYQPTSTSLIDGHTVPLLSLLWNVSMCSDVTTDELAVDAAVQVVDLKTQPVGVHLMTIACSKHVVAIF